MDVWGGGGIGDVSWREKLVIEIVEVAVVLSSVDVEGLGRWRGVWWGGGGGCRW